MADQGAQPAHLNARDTTLAFVSRAPRADIERWATPGKFDPSGPPKPFQAILA